MSRAGCDSASAKFKMRGYSVDGFFFGNRFDQIAGLRLINSFDKFAAVNVPDLTELFVCNETQTNKLMCTAAPAMCTLLRITCAHLYCTYIPTYVM